MMSWRLHKCAHTVHIWLAKPIRLKGITLSQMRKFLILFIALSTWILKEAISWVFTTSAAGIWAELPKNGGIFNDTSTGRRSWVVKPLSAMTESFVSKGRSRNPLLKIISLSDTLPVYSSFMNVMCPAGDMPISPLSRVILVWAKQLTVWEKTAWRLALELNTIYNYSCVRVLALEIMRHAIVDHFSWRSYLQLS